MKPIYQIQEYGSFITGKDIDGYVTLPERTFEQLETFILSNRSKDTDALELMGLSARKGVGKVITAKNYVGVITMNDGTTIEILPKVYSAIDDSSGKRTKKLLIDMLRTLRDSPYRALQTTNVNIEKMNIFEVFIRMFVDEVFFIVKRGLKCGYETVEENATFFRGKLKFSQQIRINHTHKERSYVEYDAFTTNRPENRLLKATLQYLYKHSVSSKNRNDIKILLNSFAEVEASVDYKSDFTKYVPDRNMKDYTTALLWSKVFLMGKSFTSFAGSEVALALLFPMETLFESYVINLEDEMEFQSAIMMSFQVMGPPPALKNYHAWLFENGFNVELPNPTNEVVASYYGVKPLWKTDYSQGIVVMAEDESDYFIVMECSSRNRGYKHTKIILTMGGCM